MSRRFTRGRFGVLAATFIAAATSFKSYRDVSGHPETITKGQIATAGKKTYDANQAGQCLHDLNGSVGDCSLQSDTFPAACLYAFRISVGPPA